MTATKKINANGTEISVLRSRSTIEYLGVWGQLHNLKFKSTEFDAFRQQLKMKNADSHGFYPIEFDGFRQQSGLNAEHRFKILPNNLS